MRGSAYNTLIVYAFTIAYFSLYDSFFFAITANAKLLYSHGAFKKKSIQFLLCN